ncbi:Hypothetical predicted protein [Olea europaea subsp. europaea]|uniref:Uncharacterized protein n=1 Tax=Olea europaea subsp. europaea TaxID=158383 RepID=A0A8S0S890_OLEEU|nr:Hypothetical predicted protein [Olea europaea subsp. europaea]
MEIRLRPCHGQDASRTWPAHCVQKLPKNAEKSGCVLAVSRTCPRHRVPKIAQQCLKIRLRPYRILDMACTPCPKNCLKMPENQAASLSRPERIANMAYTPCKDMACTPCQEIAQKYLKFMLRPCPRHGVHTMSQNSLEMFGNQVASLSRPGRIANMAYTPCPDMACLPCAETVQKYLKIRLRPWPGRIPDMAYTLCPSNCPECLGTCLRH